MFGARRAWRSLWWVVTTAVVVAALLYAVPVIRGISFDAPPGGFPVAAPVLDDIRDEPVFLRQQAPVRVAPARAPR